MFTFNPKIQLVLSAVLLVAVMVAMCTTSDDSLSPTAPAPDGVRPASASPGSVSPESAPGSLPQ
ncbi:MAG: hypothetical protein ACI9U2_003896 [Bradymonadia bacterium]|jgi:hypothetical protein